MDKISVDDATYALDVLRSQLEPIRSYMDDDSIQEIMVNSANDVWIERGGEMIKVDVRLSDIAIRASIKALAGANNKDIAPVLDCRMPGYRIAAAMSPVGINGNALCIRKHARSVRTLASYTESGVFTLGSGKERHHDIPVRPMREDMSTNPESVERMLRWIVLAKKNIIIAGSTGSGKAQPLDAKVLTPTGFVNMGDVRAGDLVRTPDGGESRVIGVFPQGEKEIYRVTTDDGRKTECCVDHLWKVRTLSRDWFVTPLSGVLAENEFGLGLVEIPVADGRGRAKIVSIESVGFKEAQCIAIDHPDQLYITDDYVVTHNTTFMNALLAEIPGDQRVITIEDTHELQVVSPNHVCLETMEPAGVDIRRLVRLSLRFRPDRVVVGEVRGQEAYDLLDVMNTGHSGGACSLHADSPLLALARLESMVRMHPDAQNLPLSALRIQIANTFNFVIYCSRHKGVRGPEAIAEVKGVRDGEYVIDTIFNRNTHAYA